MLLSLLSFHLLTVVQLVLILLSMILLIHNVRIFNVKITIAYLLQCFPLTRQQEGFLFLYLALLGLHDSLEVSVGPLDRVLNCVAAVVVRLTLISCSFLQGMGLFLTLDQTPFTRCDIRSKGAFLLGDLLFSPFLLVYFLHDLVFPLLTAIVERRYLAVLMRKVFVSRR